MGRYRHDIASIITDTVERWDAEETTEKIELMVGRDLQYIRLNGTIVGALAGVVIFTVAHFIWDRDDPRPRRHIGIASHRPPTRRAG